MDEEDHDRIVARTSHAPHAIRIAGGDPELWSDILCSNAESVGAVLRELSLELSELVEALSCVSSSDSDGSRSRVEAVLARRTEGRHRITGG